MLAEVEVAAEHPESDRRLGAALRAHHAGRARARALAERVALEQHDVADARSACRNHAVQAPIVPPPTTTASALRGTVVMTASAGID